MKKDIRVTVDANSFPGGTIPSYYNSLLHVSTIDVNCMLVHTALWTRPPQLMGFHLSDFWAWLRYIPAFSPASNDLRLRSEWFDIDPHQKTILSDEIGVGSTTYTLINTLGFQGFVDSIYLLKTLKLTHLIKTRSKNGLGKTPDYIGLDGYGRIVALECKGTQNAVNDLKKAIQKGIIQKTNITGGPISMGLVGGIYIPQYHKIDRACIQFADPEWEGFNEIISSVRPDNLTQAIIRGAIIKQLYLSGANIAASELSTYYSEDTFKLSQEATDEINALNKKTPVFSYHPKSPPQGGLAQLEFSTKIDNRLFDIIEMVTSTLTNSSVIINNLVNTDFSHNKVDNDSSWTSSETHNGCQVKTAQGFTFELNYTIS